MQEASATKPTHKATSKFIPLIRPSVGEEELREIQSVLESGWLAQGPKVKEFETGLARFLGAKYVVATSSCTTALSLAIESLGLKKGSGIIVPDFTFPATANVVIRGGCKPVFVDVSDRTYAISPSETSRAIRNRTSAIMPVHPFGHPFEMDEIYEMAEKAGIEVIEDAATAIGTRYRRRLVGSSGRAVCFSFHPRKLLTTAEGGCLATDDGDVYDKAVAMRSHGQVKNKKENIEFRYNGLNYRMSDVHAAIGIAQLAKLDAIISSRRRQAKVYQELLRSRRLDVKAPTEESWAYHTYQSFVLVLGKSFPDTIRCMRLMREKFSIETQVGTYSLKSQPAFKGVRAASDLKNSMKLYARSLTLPLFESLREEQQAYVVDSLAKISL